MKTDHKFKKTIFILLIILSGLVIFWRFLWPAFLSIANLQAKAGIKVLSTPEKATVYINNQKKGETPYEETNLSVGDYSVKIESGTLSWQRTVKLTPGTLTVVNQELNKGEGAGEILTLEEGGGVTIIASPASQVEVDGKAVGQTPIKLDLPAGEHTFVVTHENYQPRTIRANVPQKFNLILNVNLKLEEANLATNTTIAAPQLTAVKLKVLSTPTGFLRVRDKPSLAGTEIGRVNTGEELELLEERSGWDKIKTSSGLEGYVSVSYIEKK